MGMPLGQGSAREMGMARYVCVSSAVMVLRPSVAEEGGMGKWDVQEVVLLKLFYRG